MIRLQWSGCQPTEHFTTWPSQGVQDPDAWVAGLTTLFLPLRSHLCLAGILSLLPVSMPLSTITFLQDPIMECHSAPATIIGSSCLSPSDLLFKLPVNATATFAKYPIPAVVVCQPPPGGQPRIAELALQGLWAALSSLRQGAGGTEPRQA